MDDTMTGLQDRRLLDGTEYTVYVPPGGADRLLVSVVPVDPDLPRAVGAELFREFANEHRCLVLAPGFDFESDFRFLFGADTRWDVLLLSMVTEVGRVEGISVERFSLFGYSAGGQFAHRFLYVHPERLDQVAVGGIGRPTMPSADVPWPDGVSSFSTLTGKPFDVEAVCQPRILLYVGDQDLSDAWLEHSVEADRHGSTRLERSRSLHRAWLKAGIQHDYVEVPGMKHDDGGLEVVRAFLGQEGVVASPH